MGYNPRSLFYRSDQAVEPDKVTGEMVAPRYYIRAAGERTFALNSITIAFAARVYSDSRPPTNKNLNATAIETVSVVVVSSAFPAKSIVIRGLKGGNDPNKPKQGGQLDTDIAILNVTIPDIDIREVSKFRPTIITAAPNAVYTSSVRIYTSTLPQTPVIEGMKYPNDTLMVYPPSEVATVRPGVGDPMVFLHYEFPQGEKIFQWSLLKSLEISGYRDYVDIHERSIVMKGDKPEERTAIAPGEFFLKAVNITQIASYGKCAESEEDLY
ncbi:hypothetical protein TWF730_010291 [Orbilia blumenaviensis]|uniref:Uncharacterized protein n=1 Tax=Orbilia blumenaviensis TaxID=1796055 RepID=A0AAV9UMW3_9PEZI